MDGINNKARTLGLIKALLKTAFCLLLVGCVSSSQQPGRELKQAMVVSVSSDGRYAISTHKSKHLVLWNIEQSSREILSTNANIYSAYFIHDRDAFLWQDLNDQVRVQTVDGDVLKQFEHFPTYGHVMDTSLEHYIASDNEWNIFHGYGNEIRPIKKDGSSPSFLGSGKLLHLSLSEEKGFLLSAGSDGDEAFDIKVHPPILDNQLFSYYAGLILWDINTLEPIAQLPDHSFKTDAEISLDGKWIVSGDENALALYWNTQNLEISYDLSASVLGVYKRNTDLPIGDPKKWDKSQLIAAPEDYSDITVALAFINDSQEFLRFGYRSHWVALFEAGNPWPQKYFDLGDDPYPSTASYLRSLSIATSPQAKVLVTGHRYDGGITVYRYDPNTRTLTKEWVGE
nr:WD40 repeat domain-containing protein [uncultured Halomonas sp.]